MNKYVIYKEGTKVMRGSQLYDLLESGKPEDLKKAEALYKDISAKFDKNWDSKYNHLRNWRVGNS